MTLLIMAICTVLFEKLYTIVRQKEPRRQEITNCSFKMFKIMRFWGLQNVLTFTTQEANSSSSWTACSVFHWKYLFWVNLVQKLKIISLNWNFVPRPIQICKIPLWYSLFRFLTGNTSLGKLGPKNWNCQFELKFRTRPI